MRLAAIVAAAALAMAMAIVTSSSPAHAQPPRDRILRALEVIDTLALDDATMGKLFRVLSSYERDHQSLVVERDSIVEKLEASDDPLAADKLLDDHLANQRALVDADTRLVSSLRAMLPVEHAAKARAILLAPAKRPRATTPTTTCDPFAAMHGCAR